MKKLLLHLDTDLMPSAFDQAVPYDAGVDNIIAYGGATGRNVTAHVHGMIFTRSGNKLKNSAIFIGGCNVPAAELVAKAVKNAFFGAVRISVMVDPNGCNTTAAAIVRKVMSDYDIKDKNVVILGSGPVGQRAAIYLLQEGAAQVKLTSRSIARATTIASKLKQAYGVDIIAAQTCNDEDVAELLSDAHIAIAAGSAGVCMAAKSAWAASETLAIIADVNAVPPLGIEGISVMDNGTKQEGVRRYGAIAIGSLKMQIHYAAVVAMFDSNDQFLDETTIYDIARKINS